jgi:hypothetical protein
VRRDLDRVARILQRVDALEKHDGIFWQFGVRLLSVLSIVQTDADRSRRNRREYFDDFNFSGVTQDET